MAEPAGNWRKIRRLDSRQWRVLLGTPPILLITWFRLRYRGFRTTLRKAAPAAESRRPADEQLGTARDIAYAHAVAVRYGPWRPRCLPRSLSLAWFLGRRGIPFEIRIGLPKGGGKEGETRLDFEAHAWVEHAGVVLNDRQDIADDYREFGDVIGRSELVRDGVGLGLSEHVRNKNHRE